MLGEPLLELRQGGDDGLLGVVALDLAGRNARRILHRDGDRHVWMNSAPS